MTITRTHPGHRARWPWPWRGLLAGCSSDQAATRRRVESRNVPAERAPAPARGAGGSGSGTAQSQRGHGRPGQAAGAAAASGRCAAHRLLRLRQLRRQGRVPADARGACQGARRQPQQAHGRSKATPTSAAAASTTWRWARSAPRRCCKSLVLLGVQDSQLEAVSFGEERPRCRAATKRPGRKNRRVELKDREMRAALPLRAAALAPALAPAAGAQAQLFADDEARKAILDLRAKLEQPATSSARRARDANAAGRAAAGAAPQPARPEQPARGHARRDGQAARQRRAARARRVRAAAQAEGRGPGAWTTGCARSSRRR